jgi:hypothetical protein
MGLFINPKQIIIMGSTVQGDLMAPERYVNISWAMPVINQGVELWVNPSNRRLFKADPIDKQWQRVYDFSEVFAPYNTTPMANYDEAGQPVQGPSDLAAVIPLFVGQIIYVNTAKACFKFYSTQQPSLTGGIKSVSATGYWYPDDGLNP